jgi:signal recognition particle GTPase
MEKHVPPGTACPSTTTHTKAWTDELSRQMYSPGLTMNDQNKGGHPIPTCWIIAGPNGAGKTTFALEY